MRALMPLTSGTKLGPYEIQSSVGAGGMGEVYRARDTRLDRTVALKILPAVFSADTDRLHRFQHEAKVLSSLNHPNVLAIYDVGDQNGVRFLVSEFLEGQSLRETLATGTLSPRRLIEYALDIAKGLAAAHEKGIVHRDLKPDNVFITRDGRVKVLDFGLAKQIPEPASQESATMTGAVPTIPGTVMGTVGYMSPEQVRGLPLDHRSDIFSFGAVLYEMASGNRAFRGDSSVETMNAILKEEVAELSESSTHVSPGLERIIRRCLEKNPERRFQSASDLAFALDTLSAASSISRPVASTPPLLKRSGLAWISAALAALVLLASGFWFFQRPGLSAGKFSQISFRPAYIRAARFAPGRTIVYAASINGEPMTLFSTRTDTFEAQPLNLNADLLSISRSSELAVSLGRDFDVVWTPTGRLAKAPLGGGATRELLDDVIDADWNRDGSDLAVARRMGNQFRLEYPAGKVLYQTAGYISDLRFSPAGDQIAFLDHALVGDDRGALSVIDLAGHRRVLTQDFESAQGLCWSPDGKEIWFGASEAAEPNSLRAVDLSGRVRMVAAAPARLHLQDIGEDGQVLLTTDVVHYQVGTGASKGGAARDLTAFEYTSLSNISDDGSMILMNSFDVAGETNYRLYVQHTDGSSPVLVGHGAGSAFSPDKKWVAAIDPGHPENASIIPTGIGDARNLHSPAGTHYNGISLFSDDERALITTAASGEMPQSAVQDIATGSIHPIGPKDRYVAALISTLLPGPSPDGKFCIQTDGSRYWLQALEGNSVRELSGIARGEKIINWHADSNNLFVAHPEGISVQVYNLNLSTGERKLWTNFSPPDKTATAGHTLLFITPDGTHFAYESHRIYSTLFVAKGLH
jgi:serine/threonine protein kinase/Tol biopolymer transport system component